MPDPQPNGAFEWTQEPWGRALRCMHLGVTHLFTSRDVDLRDNDEEWRLVAGSLGVTPDGLLLIRQVHGTTVAVVRHRALTLPAEGGSHHRARDSWFPRSPGARWSTPEADIILTEVPDVAIGVRVADCAPILLYDTVRNVAGAIHAGWRGTAAGAATASVMALRREFGSEPCDLIAAIGPCLGACCGEVGPEVLAAFRSGSVTNADVARWFTPGNGDRSFLDLPRANQDQLVAAGIPPGQVFDSGLCTKTYHDRLHSYRAARGEAGRMLGAIKIR